MVIEPLKIEIPMANISNVIAVSMGKGRGGGHIRLTKVNIVTWRHKKWVRSILTERVFLSMSLGVGRKCSVVVCRENTILTVSRIDTSFIYTIILQVINRDCF